MSSAKKVVLGLLALVLAVVLPVGAAQAYTGSWTSTELCSNSTSWLQGHYQYDGSNVRADGYGVTLVAGHGYIRQISTVEGHDGIVVAHRDINFTGSATTSSATNISTGYLPFMPRNGVNSNFMWVYVYTSTGSSCSVAWGLPS